MVGIFDNRIFSIQYIIVLISISCLSSQPPHPDRYDQTRYQDKAKESCQEECAKYKRCCQHSQAEDKSDSLADETARLRIDR